MDENKKNYYLNLQSAPTTILNIIFSAEKSRLKREKSFERLGGIQRSQIVTTFLRVPYNPRFEETLQV